MEITSEEFVQFYDVWLDAFNEAKAKAMSDEAFQRMCDVACEITGDASPIGVAIGAANDIEIVTKIGQYMTQRYLDLRPTL